MRLMLMLMFDVDVDVRLPVTICCCPFFDDERDGIHHFRIIVTLDILTIVIKDDFTSRISRTDDP
jgi:hypothetical protein